MRIPGGAVLLSGWISVQATAARGLRAVGSGDCHLPRGARRTGRSRPAHRGAGRVGRAARAAAPAARSRRADAGPVRAVPASESSRATSASPTRSRCRRSISSRRCCRTRRSWRSSPAPVAHRLAFPLGLLAALRVNRFSRSGRDVRLPVHAGAPELLDLDRPAADLLADPSVAPQRGPDGAVEPHPADHRAGTAVRLCADPHDPQRTARGHGRGLHPDRARQGPSGADRHLPARRAQCGHPGRHDRRTPVRRPAGRRRRHRDRLLVPRHRRSARERRSSSATTTSCRPASWSSRPSSSSSTSSWTCCTGSSTPE